MNHPSDPLAIRVGPYTILRQIGQGGMSTVHLAVRSDDAFEKRVALKLIKRGMDTDDILQRFRNERQILAGLGHPNIARLLDGGSTDDGLPYFVMEYIDGAPIDQYCDRRRLPVAERLALFSTVCSAVHYAHQNLIVHRDIKPDNILVTEAGVPKLLDFGIAKLLNPDLTARTVKVTAAGHTPMTPSFASPEQVRGRAITTATDVYSLGVLLNDLLSGRLPYRVSRRDPQQIAQAIAESDPVPPSVCVTAGEEVVRYRAAPPAEPDLAAEARLIEGTPEAHGTERPAGPRPESVARLRRRLRGDLDNIVLMALRKDPQRRYASALQLAEDVGRHLRGRPVLARKETLRYRAGKFIRRNKAVVASVAVIVALAAAMTVQWVRVGRQRDLVSMERDKFAQVSGLVMNLFETADPTRTRGDSITAREVLDAGAEQLKLHPNRQVEVQAQLFGTVGGVYTKLGLHEDARPLLEQALGLRRAAPAREAGGLAESLRDLGVLLRDQGDYPQAERLLRESLDLCHKRKGGDPLALAATENELGVLLDLDHRSAVAEPLLRSALQTRQERLGPDHADVAQSLGNLARLLSRSGRPEEAVPLFRQALDIRRRLFGPEDLKVAESASDLAHALSITGDLAAAEPLMRESLEIRRAVLDSSHPDVVSATDDLALLVEARQQSGERKQERIGTTP